MERVCIEIWIRLFQWEPPSSPGCFFFPPKAWFARNGGNLCPCTQYLRLWVKGVGHGYNVIAWELFFIVIFSKLSRLTVLLIALARFQFISFTCNWVLLLNFNLPLLTCIMIYDDDVMCSCLMLIIKICLFTAIAEIRQKLHSVKHKVMVVSGKGGVGKSTFAAHLARGLSSEPNTEVIIYKTYTPLWILFSMQFWRFY
jgi:hypothetical protein